MNINKMLSLADFLEKLPRKRFDIGVWIRRQGRSKFRLILNPIKPVKPLDPNCGTVCCIAGWHVARMGMFLDGNGGVYKSKNGNYYSGNGYVGAASRVAAEDLEIDESTANNLFLDMEIRTPKQAAKRIRLMVKEEKRLGL